MDLPADEWLRFFAELCDLAVMNVTLAGCEPFIRRDLPELLDGISLEEFEFCTGCSYIPYCTGNCPGMGFNLTGEVNHPSPDACLRKFLAEGGTLP